MKDKNCPLCNKRSFNRGDDFKTLCINHSTQVIALLLEDMIGEMFIKPMRETARRE